jgi:hypothetical protein
MKSTYAHFYVLAAAVSLIFLAACGDDNGDDTAFTGLSAIIVIPLTILIIYFVVRAATKKRD